MLLVCGHSARRAALRGATRQALFPGTHRARSAPLAPNAAAPGGPADRAAPRGGSGRLPRVFPARSRAHRAAPTARPDPDTRRPLPRPRHRPAGDGARGRRPLPPRGPHPVLQLGRELALELAARAAAVVALDEHLARHRRLLRPHRAARSEPPPPLPAPLRPAPPAAKARPGAGRGRKCRAAHAPPLRRPQGAAVRKRSAASPGLCACARTARVPLAAWRSLPPPRHLTRAVAPPPGCSPAPDAGDTPPGPIATPPLCHSPAPCAITPPPKVIAPPPGAVAPPLGAVAPPPAAVSPRRVLPPAGGSERGSPSAAAAPVPVAGGGGRCLSPASCTATRQGSHARRDG